MKLPSDYISPLQTSAVISLTWDLFLVFVVVVLAINLNFFSGYQRYYILQNTLDAIFAHGNTPYLPHVLAFTCTVRPSKSTHPNIGSETFMLKLMWLEKTFTLYIPL